MAKQQMNGVALKSGGLLAKYQGKTKAVGGFAPLWRPATEGEEVLAKYLKTEIVVGKTIVKGGKTSKRDDFDSFTFEVVEGEIT